MHVLIVGAGLGGLAVAQGLRNKGISYEIFDRDESEDSRFQGWAIFMHTILDELQCSFPSDMPDLKSATNHLAPLDLSAQMTLHFSGRKGRLGFQDTPSRPYIRAERHRLRMWLLTKIEVQWGKHARRFEHDNEGVQVHFEDGTSAKGDFLIGADGINSRVREHLLRRPNCEVLQTVPIAPIVAQVTLTGEAFKRQLEIGHSGYNLVYPELGFVSFNGLHEVLPDGVSGRFFWFLMEPDSKVASPSHWLQTASQQDKLTHVLKKVAPLPPKFRDIFELTPASGIRAEPHVWRDVELASLPAGRVILLGDAAHAMSPFRGEGGYHTFVDALNLSRLLIKLGNNGSSDTIDVIKSAVQKYNVNILDRGSAAVRSSRAAHAELSKKTWTVPLVGWDPILLIPLRLFAWILRLRVNSVKHSPPVDLREIPSADIVLPNERKHPELHFLAQILSTILMLLGIGILVPIGAKVPKYR